MARYRRRVTITRSGGRRTVSRSRSKSPKANHTGWSLPAPFTLNFWFGNRRVRKRHGSSDWWPRKM